MVVGVIIFLANSDIAPIVFSIRLSHLAFFILKVVKLTFSFRISFSREEQLFVMQNPLRTPHSLALLGVCKAIKKSGMFQDLKKSTGNPWINRILIALSPV